MHPPNLKIVSFFIKSLFTNFSYSELDEVIDFLNYFWYPWIIWKHLSNDH